MCIEIWRAENVSLRAI
ncbi:hypothetical protein [Burkholderia cepacia]